MPCSVSNLTKAFVACSCNKIHKLPFAISSLSITKPLELVYTDVWGPFRIASKEGYKYYVSFIDHYTEVEYRSIALAVSELCWVQSLLKELKCDCTTKPIVLCDNLSATYTCENFVFHTRMKHLTLDYFFVYEKVSAKEMEVRHIPSSNQLADILSKLLPKARFELLVEKIGVAKRPPILRGNIRGTS